MLEALHTHHSACSKILEDFSSNDFGEDARGRRQSGDFNSNDIEDDEQAQSLLISADD